MANHGSKSDTVPLEVGGSFKSAIYQLNPDTNYDCDTDKFL